MRLNIDQHGVFQIDEELLSAISGGYRSTPPLGNIVCGGNMRCTINEDCQEVSPPPRGAV